MLNKLILFTLLTFLAVNPAWADQPPAAPPADMSDEALASYITGRLAPLLQDEGYKIAQSCDATGCAIVVQ